MLLLIEFPSPVAVTNLLTIAGFAVAGLSGYFSLRERSKTNTQLIKDILERLEVFDLGRVKFCVETLWVFQLRRGMVEAEYHNLGKEQSPFKLTDAACKLIEPLLPELKRFYNQIGGDKLGIVELSVALESSYGEQIVDLVCKKVKVTKSACMIIAVGMLRPISQEILTSALRDAEYNYKTLKHLEPRSSGTTQGSSSDKIHLDPDRISKDATN